MREIGPDHFIACHFPLERARWDHQPGPAPPPALSAGQE
jgi:hypothetical protein